MIKSTLILLTTFILLLTSSIDSLAFFQIVTVPINTSKVNLAEPANLKSINPNKLTGSIWQMQMDENKDKRGVLNNICFGTKGMMIETSVFYYDGYITKIDKERMVIYRETPTGIIVFDNEGENPLFNKVEWINDDQISYKGYIYARLGSDKDSFTRDYTEHYVEGIVEKEGEVEANFLQDIAIKYYVKHCRVYGKAYQLKGEPEDTDGYLSLEFSVNGTCFYKKNKHFSMGLREYSDNGLELRLRPVKLLSNPNRGEWNEKWKMEWLSCHEFTLSKDGKSYHYVYVGKTKQEGSISE